MLGFCLTAGHGDRENNGCCFVQLNYLTDEGGIEMEKSDEFVLPFTSCYYPESDGKPMGETDEHRIAMIRHIELLKRYYRGQKVYVTGDLLLYYEQGNNKKFLVPDLFVVKGIEQKNRRIYKLWTPGIAPCVAIETTSRKTKSKDTRVKPKLFAHIGISEYFLIDPTSDYLDPPLQGYRMTSEGYRQLVDDGQGLISEQLQLRLVEEEGVLQFYRLDNGQRLLTAEEEKELLEQSMTTTRLERDSALERVRELEAELKRLRVKDSK